MKYIYEFIGGPLHGTRMTKEEVEKIATGHQPYQGHVRALGGTTWREELDGQPTVKDYCGPMWGGLRYGAKYEFEATEAEKAAIEPVAVIRYESWEVYDMMCN